MRVPNYTTGMILERPVANQVNLREIGAAGDVAGALSSTLDVAGQIAQKIEITNEMSSVNSALIKRQKEDIDFQEEFRKQNESNPLGYAKRAEPEYKKRDDAILATLPTDRARQAYTDSATKLNLKRYEDDLNWETRRSTEMFANQADQSISDLEVMAYRGTPLDELKKQRQATALTLGAVLAPDQIAKFDANAEQRITESYIRGVLDENPYKAKQMLDGGEYDSVLGVDRLESLGNKAESAINQIEKERIKEQERQMQMQSIALAFDGKAILDPYSSDTKKAVDLYFQEYMANVEGDPAQAQLEFVSRTGVYPDAMKSAISAQLNNGTPEQKVQAANMIDSLVTANPSTGLQINESQRALSRKIIDNISAGISPSKAVSQAETSVFKKDTPEYKARLENFNKKGGEKVKFSPGLFTEFFRFDPKEIPASMQADWEIINENMYLEGLTAQQAAKEAARIVNEQWGISTADGNRRWMKYSPEKMYGNKAGAEWIGDQLRSEMADIPYISSGEKVKTLLSVDPRTIGSDRVGYQVFTQDKDGRIEPFVTQSGEQAVFFPDYLSSPQYRKNLEKFSGDAEKAMAYAIRQRDAAANKEEEAALKKQRKFERSRKLLDYIKDLTDDN